MAFYTDTNVRPEGFLAKVLGFAANTFHGLALKAEQRRIRRTTFKELAALSDRELADMGVHRSHIRRIANESAA